MSDVAILVLRVSMGIIMMAHGAHKLQKRTVLDKKWSEKYGLPVGSVASAGILQIVGGLALVLGVSSSVAAFVLAVVMLVATYVSIWKEREPFLSTPAGKGYDFNLFLVVSLAILIFMGDGAWSLMRVFMPGP